METLPLPHSMWVPSFNFSNSDVEMMSRVDDVANEHHPITLESPPSCAGEDIYCGVMSKDHQVTDNTYTHTAQSYSHGFRSKISSILSLEKRGTLATSPHILGRGNSCAKNDNISSRRASMAAESRVFESNRGSGFGAHRFVDCCGEVNKNMFHGECSGRSSASGAWGYGDAHGSRPDVPWMDSSENGGGWCNSNSGDSHWHSEQRNVLMRTLHKMRCDIESLKVRMNYEPNSNAWSECFISCQMHTEWWNWSLIFYRLRSYLSMTNLRLCDGFVMVWPDDVKSTWESCCEEFPLRPSQAGGSGMSVYQIYQEAVVGFQRSENELAAGF